MEANERPTVAASSRKLVRRAEIIGPILVAVLALSLLVPASATAFPNSAIADRAEQYPDGAVGGECLPFAEDMIRAAGGPSLAFGNDTSQYQSKWAQNARSVGSIDQAQRGDIIQWGGGAGGTIAAHTAIVTQPGADPAVIDSNWGRNHLVHRGMFSSRNLAGSVYKIWRVGEVGAVLGSASTAFDPNNDTVYIAVQGPGNTLALYWNPIGQIMHGPLYASGGAGKDVGPPSITYDPTNNTLYMAAQGPGNTLNLYWNPIGQQIGGPLPAQNGAGKDVGPPSIHSRKQGLCERANVTQRPPRRGPCNRSPPLAGQRHTTRRNATLCNGNPLRPLSVTRSDLCPKRGHVAPIDR